jgi:hypothetical protein
MSADQYKATKRISKKDLQERGPGFFSYIWEGAHGYTCWCLLI